MSEAAGAAVFGVFVVGMTIGRTAGTVALDRWGRVPVLIGTIGLAAVGAGLAVLAGSGPVALVGVALWGLGASLGFPVGMSAAADEEAHAPARVSVVAVIGYTAFLAGPPLVGLLGDRGRHPARAAGGAAAAAADPAAGAGAAPAARRRNRLRQHTKTNPIHRRAVSGARPTAPRTRAG